MNTDKKNKPCTTSLEQNRVKSSGDTITEPNYNEIFQHSVEAIVILDDQLSLVNLNPAARSLLGLDHKDDSIHKLDIGECFADRRQLELLADKIRQEGFVRDFKAWIRKGSGREVPVLITANSINHESNKECCYVVFIRNLSQHKMMEDHLKQANIELQALNKIAKIVSRSLDINEILGSAVDTVRETLTADSVRIYLLDNDREFLDLAISVGLSDEFISRPHMRSRKVGDGLLGKTAKEGVAIIIEDLRKSGTPFKSAVFEEDLQAAAYIPLLSKGELLGVISVSTHFPHKFTSKDLEFLTGIGVQIGMAIHNARLYAKVKSAYEELQATQEQLVQSEKLASLGKLAATIAHEINNPLSAVITYLKLMSKLFEKKPFPKEKIEDMRRFLHIMETETVRCGNIVKDLLIFARESVVHKKPNNIEAIINLAQTILNHRLQASGITFKKEIDPNLPPVPCDFQQMQQVVLNLVSNAIEAVSSDGCISVDARYLRPTREAEIIVADNGSGIDPDDLPHIFEPFFTTKKECKGVGLGLAIVYGIIQKHNGRISVRSVQGKGTTFTIRLPIEEY